MASVDLAALDEQELADWLLDRRWFGSKARDVASIHVLDVVALNPSAPAPPALSAALVDARYPGGTHDVYQLLLGVGSNGGDDSVIGDVRGVTVYDAFADPRACELLGGLLREGAEVHGEHARVEFHWLPGGEPAAPGGPPASSPTGSRASSRRDRAPPCARWAPSSPTRRSSSTTSSCSRRSGA